MKRMSRSTRFASMPLLVQEDAATSPTRLRLGDACEAFHCSLACSKVHCRMCSTCASAVQEISNTTFAQCALSDTDFFHADFAAGYGEENFEWQGRSPEGKEEACAVASWPDTLGTVCMLSVYIGLIFFGI